MSWSSWTLGVCEPCRSGLALTHVAFGLTEKMQALTLTRLCHRVRMGTPADGVRREHDLLGASEN